RVRQDQPTFRISVDHFDRASAQASDYISGLDRSARWKILRRWNDADHTDIRSQSSDHLHRAYHRRASAHVVLHLVHLGGRFYRDPTGVKRDPFTNQRDKIAGVLLVGLIRLIVQNDQASGLLASSRDGQQGAHSEPLHLIFAQSLESESYTFSHLLRSQSKLGR